MKQTHKTKQNKFFLGFTLVETLVSMIIIMLVCVLMMSLITKTVKRQEVVTTRGQFACWWDDGRLYQWQSDERTTLSPEPKELADSTNTGDICILKLNQRPARFYVVARGAGNNETGSARRFGQVITAYSDELGNDIGIRPGVYDENNHESGVTRIAPLIIEDGDYNLGAEILDAKGYQQTTTTNGILNNHTIIASNVSECRLTTAGRPCVDDAALRQTSCSPVEVTAYDSSGAPSDHYMAIKLNGCVKTGEDGNHTDNGIFEIGHFSDVSTLTNRRTNYGILGSANPQIGVNLLFKDSSYRSDITWDKMSMIVGSISSKRSSSQTCLKKGTDDAGCMKDVEPAAKLFEAITNPRNNRYGAVLILW